MSKRYVAIWFRHLTTDALSRRQPSLRSLPFVLALPDHGRLVITAVNEVAQQQGVHKGMVVADARAIIPSLHVVDDETGRNEQLLHALAEWCIRYTPLAAIDLPEGILLDCSGCAHLWGGERQYLENIENRLKGFGYDVCAAIADTIGTAWAVARFGKHDKIINSGQQTTALLLLPTASLRLPPGIVEWMLKLGLRQVKDFIGMPRPAMRRRFGKDFLLRLDQALGYEQEIIEPVIQIEPYQERLPCLEPITTAIGIEIALKRLLESLCQRLKQVQKGLRKALFKCYRMEGKIEEVTIGTNMASNSIAHLFRLFEFKLDTIEPGLGIELFILEAIQVENIIPLQERFWEKSGGLENPGLSELLDHLGCKIGAENIHRYIPDEHHWPERSIKQAASFSESPQIAWEADKSRPIQLLTTPEQIEVMALIPDYPPIFFRYKGQLHNIKKADGPERIEQEWWLQDGLHRDYYIVEDEEGKRYWLFRSGHYDTAKSYRWFIHGFFA